MQKKDKDNKICLYFVGIKSPPPVTIYFRNNLEFTHAITQSKRRKEGT